MKFVKYFYDKKYSVVTLKHHDKMFVGYMIVHPDENPEYLSEIFGCSIAESRAEIKFLKHKLSLIKEEISYIKKFLNDCKCYKNWDEDDNMGKICRKQLYLREKKKKQLIADIQKYEDFIKQKIEDREKQIQSYKNKEEKDKSN